MTNCERSLAAERQAEIMNMVRRRRAVRVEELCAATGVSSATVRRDLAELETQGALRRVHGGAVSVEGLLDEPPFDDKAGLAVEQKRAIAGAAAAFLRKGETIYLDGGSTVLELARCLHDRGDLTVVTNSLRAVAELSAGGPRVIMIGGDLRRRSQTLVGPLSGLLLEQMNFDRAFMGTIGLTPEDGMTTTDPGEAYTKKCVMRRAREVILLADSSKMGVVSFARCGNLRELDRIITDYDVPREVLTRLKKNAVEVIRTGGPVRRKRNAAVGNH